MPVLVRNEKSDPYIFEAGRNGKTLHPGDVELLSDDEWDSIVFSQRGPGKVNPLWPSTSDGLGQTRLDYDLFVSDYAVKYIGQSPQGILASENGWTIRRLDYVQLGGENMITEIQVLEDVAWDDRETLPWT